MSVLCYRTPGPGSPGGMSSRPLPSTVLCPPEEAPSLGHCDPTGSGPPWPHIRVSAEDEAWRDPRMSQSVSGCCASGAGGVRPGVRGGYGSYNPPTPVKEREGGAQTAQQTRKDPRGTVHRSRSSGGIQYLPEACREGQPRGIFCHCPTRKHVASVLLTASRLRVSCDFRETGTRLH